MSFASEGVNSVDHGVAPYTFRIQGAIYHRLPSLVPGDGERPRFAQIYIVDSTQNQADDRLHHNPSLNRTILAELYQSLHETNPYIEGLKTCVDRVKDSEIPENAHVRLVMQDPQRHDPRTYNRPTSDEVAVVIVGDPDDARRLPTDRDIAVEY